MNRVSYDRFWGLMLLATCVMPVSSGLFVWQVLEQATNPFLTAWLVAGSIAGLLAFVMGLCGIRSRWRHFLNFALGVATLAIPMFAPEIWQRFPHANPATLPLSDLAMVGWVMLVGLGALYAGAGVRIARPGQTLGQSMCGLGAFLLAVFAFLPAEGATESYAQQQLRLFKNYEDHWRALVPFAAIGASAIFGIVNLVRTPLEVILAKLTRLLLVGGMLFWIALPFLEKDAPLSDHLPVAWGTLRLLGPLFLALDGCVAFVAISVTRESG